MILLRRLAAKGFYDPESGFGEGCAYNVGLGQQLCIPTGRKLTAAGNVVTAVPLRGRNECRDAMGENAIIFLGMCNGIGGGLPREYRPYIALGCATNTRSRSTSPASPSQPTTST